MKKAVLFVVVLMIASVTVSKGQSGWNESVGLYNSKIVDQFKDDSGGWWYLMIGETLADWTFNKSHTASMEEMGDSHNSLIIYHTKSHMKVKVPNYLIEHNKYGGSGSECFIDACFSPMVNGFPQYVYYTLPTYTTDNAIYRYDIQNSTVKEMGTGDLVSILPSGNLLVKKTGFDYDKNGNMIPGRRAFDCIVSPEGKTVWKSNSYDL